MPLGLFGLNKIVLKSRFILRQPYFNIPFDLHAEIWPIDKNSLELMVSYKKIIPEELINKIVKKFIGYLNSLKVE